MTAYDKKTPRKLFAPKGSKPKILMEAPRSSADEEEGESKETAKKGMNQIYASLVHGKNK
jgi:hypothetical protein